MGWMYRLENSYAVGLMLLSNVALAAAVSTGAKMRGLATPPAEDTTTQEMIIRRPGTLSRQAGSEADDEVRLRGHRAPRAVPPPPPLLCRMRQTSGCRRLEYKDARS